MNCRHGRGTVCRGNCGSQPMFSRRTKLKGTYSSFSTKLGTTTLCVLNKQSNSASF